VAKPIGIERAKRIQRARERMQAQVEAKHVYCEERTCKAIDADVRSYTARLSDGSLDKVILCEIHRREWLS